MIGDVNGDGVINISDVVCLINYILEKDNPIFIYNAADVNNDGSINISDVTSIVDLIINNP